MNQADLKAPFPWFGGKSRVAAEVWERFGDARNYVEPFAGSCAVLLRRPGWTAQTRWVETVNDADLLLVNFWRALRVDPDGVAAWCDYPVSGIDLTARHRWLVQEARPALRALRLDRDPEVCDVKAAGWWVWGISQWIGSGWCPEVAPEFERGETDRAAGLHEKMPHISCGYGMGIHQRFDRIPGVAEQAPFVGAFCYGQGIHQRFDGGALAFLRRLAQRLRHVRLCHGDWSAVCGDTPTDVKGRVLTAVFLDPPYDGHEGVYGAAPVSSDVRAWAQAAGERPTMRIALCGYGEEHDALLTHGWTRTGWKAGGGYSNQRDGGETNNAHREAIWYSPHCLPEPRQLDLLGGAP